MIRRKCACPNYMRSIDFNRLTFQVLCMLASGLWSAFHVFSYWIITSKQFGAIEVRKQEPKEILKCVFFITRCEVCSCVVPSWYFFFPLRYTKTTRNALSSRLTQKNKDKSSIFSLSHSDSNKMFHGEFFVSTKRTFWFLISGI